MPKLPPLQTPPVNSLGEFPLLIGGVTYMAHRYAQLALGGQVVCGYVLNPPSGDPYLTTATSCTCADHKFRKTMCKHMQAIQELEAGK